MALSRLSVRVLTVLLVGAAPLGGCDEFTDAASEAEVRLLTPTRGDTVHVAAGSRPASGEARLVWETTLPANAGAHRIEREFTTSPTFDASVSHTFASTRYDRAQQSYSDTLPRPAEFGPDIEAVGPVQVYWRVRVAGGRDEAGPWSTPGTFVVVADLPEDVAVAE